MNSIKLRLFFALSILAGFGLAGCASVESAAKNDCTSIGWEVGTPGYESCYKDRLRERQLDYSLPPGDQPSPSLL